MNPSLTCTRSIAALIACAFAALAATSATAQTTATTDPVGFITLSVAGTGGSVSSQLSFEGLSLTTPVLYQGSAETVGASSLTDNEATWTDDQFNAPNGEFYLEVTSGSAAGTTYNILDTVAATKTVTLTENLAAGVASGATFKIRKHWTIGAVFGTSNPPESGLQPGNTSTADRILIYNGSSYDTYFYSSGGGPGVGWRKIGGGSTPYTTQKINQDDGVIIERKQTSNLGVILMGAVKTGQSSIPVFSGLNFVGNVYAANMTLGSSGLFTGSETTGVKPGNTSTADQVLIYNGSSYDTYFYSSGGGPGVGWRKIGGGSTPYDTQPISVATAVIISRKPASGFNWIAPQHPATL